MVRFVSQSEKGFDSENNRGVPILGDCHLFRNAFKPVFEWVQVPLSYQYFPFHHNMATDTLARRALHQCQSAIFRGVTRVFTVHRK